MKTILGGVAALCLATGASAATVPGLSNFTVNGDGSVTFIFDSVGSDIDGTGMGLSFSGGGLSFVASSAQGIVRQDAPANGGLGVLSAAAGTDNLELGLGETLLLSFTSDRVKVVNWTFNGELNKNGHQDASNGLFAAQVSNGQTLVSNTSVFDGVGTDFVPDSFSSVCDFAFGFCNTDSILFTENTAQTGAAPFKGYLESITIAAVPLPASLAFLLAGVAGLGTLSRKRKKS